MRLLARRARKLQERAAAAACSGEPFALVWSDADDRLSDEAAAGHDVAVDLYADAEGENPWRAVERVAVDPDDLGTVYDGAGLVVGHVVARAGSRMTVEYVAGAEGAAMAEVAAAGGGPVAVDSL